MFPSLDAGTQRIPWSPNSGMVDASLLDDAKFNLTGIGWAQRDRLLASLDHVDIAPKQALARALRSDGIKVGIPGVEADERPWR